MAELDTVSAQWLRPALTKYGAPLPDKKAIGGWQLSVTTKGGIKQNLMGTLNASDDAYRSIMKASIVPKARPGAVVLPKPTPAPRPVMAPKIMRTAIADPTVILWSASMVSRYLSQIQREEVEKRHEEDTDVMVQAAAAAQAAAARSATRVRQRKLTKRKVAGRVKIHGYSRRSGLTVKDFKRKSPRE